MNYILLAATIMLQASQNILQKHYNNKTNGHTNAVYLFNTASTFCAMIFFFVKGFVLNGTLEYHAPTLISAILFGITYFGAATFEILTMRNGPLALSALVLSYSLIIPTLYGIIFLKDPLSPFTVTGLALLVISIFLTNYQKSERKITVKWVIFAVLTFISNGACATVQKVHQVIYPGEYTSEFMAYGMIVAFSLCLIVMLSANKFRRPDIVKLPVLFGTTNGVLNASMNMVNVILASAMAASLMYPLLSAGQIIITFIASFAFFRERFTKLQYAGLFIGIAAVVFLNM